jgi:hypothetical protein
MNGTDIVEDATEVVETYLSLIETLAAAKQFQAESRSRLVCRCPSCGSARSQALLWVRSMREGSVAELAAIDGGDLLDEELEAA